MYDMSSLSGIFSPNCNYSVQKPLYAKGERNCISNYRPVSLMTYFQKFLKRLSTIDYLDA